MLVKQSAAKHLSDHSALLAEIVAEWDAAERVIKRAEQVALDASIPAINELRYAGRRIVDALNAANNGGATEAVRAYLDDARFDCHRARHDAMDSALDIMAKDFDNLTKRLGVENVIAAYPAFSELYVDFAKARKQIAASRGDRENRNAIYDTIMNVDFVGANHSPGLADRYTDLVTAKPIALAFRARQVRQRIGWWVMLAITLVSLSVAATSLRMNLLRSSELPMPASQAR